MERVKAFTSEKLDMQKKLKETESLQKTLSEKNTEISNLKAEVKTNDGFIVMAKAQIEQAKVKQEGSDEVTNEIEVKKCKKCKFNAPNLKVIALHIENNHQLEFVCSNKFKAHNELKQHIQKRLCRILHPTQSGTSTMKTFIKKMSINFRNI